MTRLEAFKSLRNSAFYGKDFWALSHKDLSLCFDFLKRHAADDGDRFVFAVNRMFLDQKEKPKAKAIIQDLLIAAHSLASRGPGRPPKPEGQMVRLDLRVSKELREELESEAKKEGLDLGPYVRGILEKRGGK